MSAPVRSYDEKRDLAVYDASKIEYMIDTGIFIDCPDCGHHNTLSRSVEDGCHDWGDNGGCGRGPWSVEVRQ